LVAIVGPRAKNLSPAEGANREGKEGVMGDFRTREGDTQNGYEPGERGKGKRRGVIVKQKGIRSLEGDAGTMQQGGGKGSQTWGAGKKLSQTVNVFW